MFVPVCGAFDANEFERMSETQEKDCNVGGGRAGGGATGTSTRYACSTTLSLGSRWHISSRMAPWLTVACIQGMKRVASAPEDTRQPLEIILAYSSTAAKKAAKLLSRDTLHIADRVP